MKKNEISRVFKKYLGEDADVEELMRAEDKEPELKNYLFAYVIVFEGNPRLAGRLIGESAFYFKKNKFNYWILGTEALFVREIGQHANDDVLLKDFTDFFQKESADVALNAFFGVSPGKSFAIRHEDIFFPTIALDKVSLARRLVDPGQRIVKEI